MRGPTPAGRSQVLEHSPLGRRGYFGSFTLQGTQFGQILAAAIFLPLATFLSDDAFKSWGWRIPFLLSVVVIVAGYLIRRRVDETPAFTEETKSGEAVQAPIAVAFKESGGTILRVFMIQQFNIIAVTTSVFGATYATNKDYGVGFAASVYLWIPILGNICAVAVIPFVGNLSDKIGRRPLIMIATIGCGLLSFAYLWSISQKNVPLAIFFSLLMWGTVYQGQNAVYPAFYPEQFPTKTRVTGMAIGHNLGTAGSSAMAFVFPLLAPPGSGNVPLIVGGVTFLICCISFVGAYISPETYRLRAEDLGVPGAQPIPEDEYLRLRQESIDRAKAQRASVAA